MMSQDSDLYCNYSDLPSPLAYMEKRTDVELRVLSNTDKDRIIEMAWEDRTPFDAIKVQFGLRESDVRELMKKELKPKSYILWRERVETCKTKHAKIRDKTINRFKSKLQRAITVNKISKR